MKAKISFSLLIVLLFVVTPNFSATLPKATSLLKLLPDKIDGYTAIYQSSKTSSSTSIGKAKISGSEMVMASKIYQKGEQKVKASLIATIGSKNQLKSNNFNPAIEHIILK